MMFTPTPPARRPRPPGSLNRSRAKMATSAGGRNVPKVMQPATVVSDTSLSTYLLKRKEMAFDELSRISDSPGDGDIGDVSLTLDLAAPGDKAPMAGASSLPAIGLMANDQAQPSPPPPYGQELLDPLQPASGDGAHTPPRQDSGMSSRRRSSDHEKDADAMDLSLIEEHLRIGRAKEAAKSLGLEMEFDLARQSSRGSSETDTSPEGAKKKLRQMKHRLKQRDNELKMAARVAEQALQSHEALLAILPANVIAQLPQLLSNRVKSHHRKSSSTSSASSILDPHRIVSPVLSSSSTTSPPSTYRAHLSQLSWPALHNRRPSIPQWSALAQSANSSRSPNATLRLHQIESDERVAALEQLLSEAHESEEAQRKQAARLRKDLNKLQREFAAAEMRYAADQGGARSSSAPGGAWTRRQGLVERDFRGAYLAQKRRQHEEENEEHEVAQSLAWGHGAQAGPSRQTSQSLPLDDEEDDNDDQDGDVSQVAEHLADLSTGTIRHIPSGSARPIEMKPVDEIDSSSSAIASPPKLPIRSRSRSRSLSRKSGKISFLTSAATRLRKKVSASSFLSPPKAARRSRSPATPTLVVEADYPTSGGTVRTQISVLAPSRGSSRASKRTPYPSPRPDEELQASMPDSPSPSRFLRSPSAALSSLSMRMASVRSLVTSGLQRTLGSELGSSFGDTSPSRAGPSQAKGPKMAQESAPEEAGEWTDEEIFSEDQCSPAPLPPRVSEALSSLAIALAPASVFPLSQDSRVPILPRGSLRDPGLGSSTYELLSEAVKHRSIRWAESGTPPLMTRVMSSSSSKGKRKSPPTLATRAPIFGGSLQWAPVDPWETGDYSDDLSDPPSRSRGSSSTSRPVLWRSTSSSSTIALAHRRLNTSQTRSSLSRDDDNDNDDLEPSTIPAKVVNDMVVIVAITLEWIECLAIIVIKVGINVRYNHRPTINWRRRRDGQPRRTYYI